MTHYEELDQYTSKALQYFIELEFPYNDDTLDYISTGYMILSIRQNKDYSSHITDAYKDYIEYLIGVYDDDDE